MNGIFRDRVEAGQLLAKRLSTFARRDDVIIVALPRGGVPIGLEVACALSAPLVRKFGVPGHEDVTMGAVASNGAQARDWSVISSNQVHPIEVDAAADRALADLKRRSLMYRGERPSPQFRDMIVILLDEGILTGATMRLAVQLVQPDAPRSIIVATPVAPSDVVKLLSQQADDVVSVFTPTHLESIAEYYGDFDPTSDDEVVALLTRAAVRFGRPDRAREVPCHPQPRSL